MRYIKKEETGALVFHNVPVMPIDGDGRSSENKHRKACNEAAVVQYEALLALGEVIPVPEGFDGDLNEYDLTDGELVLNTVKRKARRREEVRQARAAAYPKVDIRDILARWIWTHKNSVDFTEEQISWAATCMNVKSQLPFDPDVEPEV